MPGSERSRATSLTRTGPARAGRGSAGTRPVSVCAGGGQGRGGGGGFPWSRRSCSLSLSWAMST